MRPARTLQGLLTVLGGGVLIWACSNPNIAGGKLHFDQGRFEKALETFRLARAQQPASGEARLWLGRCFAELERADSTSTDLSGADSASACFTRAVELEPRLAKEAQDLRGHYWSERQQSGISSAKAGGTRFDAGDKEAANQNFETALLYFRRASIYSPGEIETQKNIGKMLFNLGKLDEALATFDKVRSMAPDDESTTKFVASVYQDQGDKAFDASQSLAAEDSVKARAGFATALDFYKKALALQPDEADLHFRLATANWELSFVDARNSRGYIQTAADEYQKVLEGRPDDIDVMYNLALAYRETERFQDAEATAKHLLDLKPKEGNYHELLGTIQNRLGNKKGFETGVIFGKCLKTGSQVDPGQADAHAQSAGAGSDMARRMRESGKPEEIRTFQLPGSSEYECWFYWTRGTGYAFVGGAQRYETHFAPVK